MKGKNWVVSLLAVGVVLPFAEVLLVNCRYLGARNFEVEIETIIVNEGEKCPSDDGSIPCPS